MHLLGMSFPFFYRQAATPTTTDKPLQPPAATMAQPEITWEATDNPGPKRHRSEYWLTDDPGVRHA